MVRIGSRIIIFLVTINTFYPKWAKIKEGSFFMSIFHPVVVWQSSHLTVKLAPCGDDCEKRFAESSTDRINDDSFRI